MKLTQYLLRALKSEHCDFVFLVPGGTIDPLFQDLLQLEQLPIPIVAAHENCATYMADAFARITSRFGVVLAIGGPGVSNTVSGVAAACADNVPVLVIGGHIPTMKERQGGFQDAASSSFNEVSVMEQIVTHSERVILGEGLPGAITDSFRHMLGVDSGPAYLAIPKDIQDSAISDSIDYLPITNVLIEKRELLLNKVGFENFAQEICEMPPSTRIVLVVGERACSPEARTQIRSFAERFHIPVATSLGAKGALPEDHPLSLGVMGYCSTQHSERILLDSNIEVLLVLGCTLNERTSWQWSNNLTPKVLIQVDLSEKFFSSNLWPQYGLRGSAVSFLKAFFEHSSLCAWFEQNGDAREDWLSNELGNTPRFYEFGPNENDERLHPARVISHLRDLISEPVNVTVDSGAHRVFMGHYWTVRGDDVYLTSSTMAPMGWAIAGAIGASIARPDRKTICVTGDGCMLMHGTEIVTAAKYDLDVLYLVINNSCYGNPQLRFLDNKPVADGFNLPTCDFAQFAASLGLKHFSINDEQDLESKMIQAVEYQGARLVDVKCSSPYTPVERYKSEGRTIK